MKQEIRLLQASASTLGFAPGPSDGLWGPKTRAGLQAMRDAHQGRWGDPVLQIGRALIDLGYLAEGPLSRVWTPELDRALGSLIAAEGLPNSGAVTEPAPQPAWPVLRPGHGNRLFQGRAGHLVQLFVIHTTATPTGWGQGRSNTELFAEIRRWHLANGWRDIGYHGVIFPDGEVIEGRAWGEIGAHVVGHNAGSLGYSMVPIRTITRIGAPEDFYTDATLSAMRAVIAKACARTPITRIAGHNEFAAKLCPGFPVTPEEWAPAGWA